MKIGKLDIKKAYYGSKELTTNNAFVGSVQLIDTSIDTPPTGWVTFKANQSSTIGLNRLSSYQKLLYSNNKKDWNVFDTSTSISMSVGDEIYVAGILKRDINQNDYTNFKITGDMSVSGNIVYLWNYNNSKASLKQYCGYNLFYGCTGLKDASELTLGTSDTILANNCYSEMFYNCSSLTTAPELPATTLAPNCYNNIFLNCTSLTTGPELPATTLAKGCYYCMFYGCRSLIKAPVLPATTLADSCYSVMFKNCTSLTTAPELPAITLANYCYDNMFYGCSSLNYIKCLAVNGINQNRSTNYWVYGVSSTGTFISNVDYSWPTGIHGIPEGWDASQKEFVGLTFTAQEDNSSIGLNQLSTNQTLEYSTDAVTWNTFNTATNISLNTGDKVYVRGKLIAGNTYSNHTQFTMSGKIAASGNTNSIWDYEDLNAPLKQYCGCSLFYDCTSLTAAPELPATILESRCYIYMFDGCSSLTSAPELPATTLAMSCYDCMFFGCTSLIKAPKLPATTLGYNCYAQMFRGCTGLIIAPELPATVLTSECYSSMFSGCTSLTIAPELPATVLTSKCYSSMFEGCTSLTIAPELPAIVLTSKCYSSMFRNCSSLKTAPVLPAVELADYCYLYMFAGCTSLNYIKCLAVNVINTNNSTTNWVSGVASTGTFVKDAKANWPTGTGGIPEGWTIEKANYPGLKFEAIEDSEFSWTCNVSSFENKFYYSLDDGKTWTNYTDPIPFSKGTILCLKGDYPEGLSNGSRTVRFVLSGKVKASGNIMSLIDNGACNTLTIPCNSCFRELFRDCISLITPPELMATTLKDSCYENMFRNCTSLVYPPELPATTLANYCYSGMFEDCTSLTTAPELPATTLLRQCYYYMFNGCTSLVYPPALPATTLANYCYSSMFNGCTSLVYPPALPATTLAYSCYQNMFLNCKNLIIAPELPATILADYCYESMFEDCTSLTTAPELPATTLAISCYWSMFSRCSSLTTAPELPATTLASGCYYGMFYYCTSLNYIKCLAVSGINTNNSTTNWVSGVPSTGTFVKNPESSWPTGDSGIPSGWEVIDAK